jgi:hypothetical protein
VDVDATGAIWVMDRGNSRIQRFSATGVFIAKFGSVGLDTGQLTLAYGIAIDGAGRVLVADSGNHRVQAFVDLNGPDTTITSGPGIADASTTATFAFATVESGTTFECKLDAASFAPCVSGVSYPGLAEGPHSFSVRAYDSIANLGDAATYDWSVDTQAPDASITGSPGLLTASTNAGFSFTSDEPGSTFGCQLDAGTAAPCTSPYTSTVASGDHTFDVWAIDLAGNVGPHETYSWTVDAAPPTASITSGPNGYVAANNATFGFTSADGGATFECKLDGLAYGACTSPTSYTGLTAAAHTFTVRAIDDLGNVGNPAQRTWTVDASGHHPDAQIATGTTYVGDDVYNPTGTNQSKTLKGAAGQTLTFKLRTENDGTDLDPYLLQGPGSAKGYTVTYYSGATNITTKVVDGSYKLTLDPGASKSLTVKVKVGASAKPSLSLVITLTSTHEPSKLDAVKAIAKKS